MGKKYFYRAFSRNAEGIGYGTVYDFLTPQAPQGPAWSMALPANASKWWKSPWMGSFYMDGETGWIMHQEMGWLFPMAVPGQGVWLWHTLLGWVWTDDSLYPFFYGNRDAGWLYFYGSQNSRSLFYNYATGKWMALNTSQK